MRNPNGWGGVIKMGGKRRKPYCARITDGWVTTPEGKQKQNYKIIGYFKKHQEALDALSAYHDNPAGYNLNAMTFAEVHKLWFEQKEKENLDRSTINAYKNSYSICVSIKDIKMSDIKTSHLQSVIDKSGKNHPMLRKFKSFLSGIYNYAMANDIVNKDYSAFVNIGKPNEKKIVRTPFSLEEIKKLWSNVEKYEFLDTILIQIYTGLRIGELLAILNADVHIEEKYMVGGLKSEAGKRRTIPLHNRIIPLIQKRYSENNLLIVSDGAAVSYDNYLTKRWWDIMNGLEMNHLPHDCRHTFATLADTYGMNKLCRKRIMGHAVSDVTDHVYTHKLIEELIDEVNKLP
jgi:integrase